MSGGTQRAATRLAAYREAQNDRLANAVDRPPSRQVLRHLARRSGKMPVGMSRKEWHQLNGYPK